MKSISFDSKSVTVEQLLEEAARGEVVFLTADGETRFAIVPADDGDREVAALRSNAEFMAYLTDAEARARTRPRKTIEEIRAVFDTAATEK